MLRHATGQNDHCQFRSVLDLKTVSNAEMMPQAPRTLLPCAVLEFLPKMTCLAHPSPAEIPDALHHSTRLELYIALAEMMEICWLQVADKTAKHTRRRSAWACICQT